MNPILVVAAWLAFQATSPISADLEFTPPRLDLGSVKAGQLFSQIIEVRNVGELPLKLASIKASCGCLAPKLEPQELAPGAIGKLHLHINSLASPSGPQGWRATLQFENGATAEYLVIGDVAQELVLSPNTLTIYGGRRTTQHTLVLQDRRSQALTLLKAESTSPLIEVGALPALSGAPAWGEIKLTIREGFPEGRHEETVTLHTSDAGYPRLQVPITIVSRSVSRYIALPSRVTLRSATDTQQVTIRDRQEQALKLDRCEPSHPNLLVEVVRGEGASLAVRVRWAAERPRPTGNYSLRVFLVGVERPVTVPVDIR